MKTLITLAISLSSLYAQYEDIGQRVLNTPALKIGTPLTRPYTANSAGVTAKLLAIGVVNSSNMEVKKAAVSDATVMGVAMSTATSGTVQVALHGPVLCTFENTAVANELVISGTGTAGNCRSSGQTVSTSIASTVQVIGRVVNGGAAGDHVMDFFGPGIFGAQSSGGGGGGARPYLNYQGTQSNVLGDGTLFTYTLPGNTMGATGCVSVTWNLASITKSGSAVFNLSFGGTVTTFKPQPATGLNYIGKFLICNTGATNSQAVLLEGPIYSGASSFPEGFGPGVSITYSADTTVNQVIALTVSGSTGGNSVGPGYFIVY